MEPAGRALEPAGRASEPAGWTLEPANRALEPAGRVSEQARRASEEVGGPRGGRRRTNGNENEENKEKRYMVSGSLSPLICFFDVSYLVSFVVRGQWPRRGR